MKRAFYWALFIGLLAWAINTVYYSIKIIRAYQTQHQLDERLQQQLTRQSATITELTQREQFYEGIVLAQQAEVKAKEDAKKAHADFIQAELKCMADNIYNEAAFEPAAGQLAVATVVMNRVNNPQYPNTVCGTVYERHLNRKDNKIVCQFSWTCRPRHHVVASVYRSIMTMARQVYFRHERSDEVATATLYYADYIQTPNWASDDAKLAQIGHHIFYSH